MVFLIYIIYEQYIIIFAIPIYRLDLEVSWKGVGERACPEVTGDWN